VVAVGGEALGDSARKALAEFAAPNVTVMAGRLTDGCPAQAPYDVILLNGATEVVPRKLLGQLKDSGRLVCVLRNGPAGKGTTYRLTSGHVSAHTLFDAAAPLLPGFAKPAEFVF